MPSKPKSAPIDPADQYILRDAIYSADSARARMGGMGEWAWRTLLKSGLPQIKVAGKCLISGAALIDHLANMAKKEGA